MEKWLLIFSVEKLIVLSFPEPCFALPWPLLYPSSATSPAQLIFIHKSNNIRKEHASKVSPVCCMKSLAFFSFCWKYLFVFYHKLFSSVTVILLVATILSIGSLSIFTNVSETSLIMMYCLKCLLIPNTAS